MFKNYFNIALRNLLKHKFYSLLNIAGLSIGLSCFMFIALFTGHELTYDQFHADADRIYRVDFRATLNGADHIAATVGAPTAAAMKNDFPEIEDAIRLDDTGNWFVKRKGTLDSFKEEFVLRADSNFFNFFSIDLIYGDKATALSRPQTLVLDQTTAKKIFGDINPIGEVLTLDRKSVV